MRESVPYVYLIVVRVHVTKFRSLAIGAREKDLTCTLFAIVRESERGANKRDWKSDHSIGACERKELNIERVVVVA